MKKKSQNQQVYSIIFGIPLYGVDVCIIVGARTKEDVVTQLRKHHAKEEVINRFVSDENFQFLLKQDAGSVVDTDKLEIIYTFREWKDDAYWQKVLVHEVSHMVDDIARHKNLVKETEARAYLSEYLFDTIRKSL